MEPLDASAGLRERLARLKMASKRRAARAGRLAPLRATSRAAKMDDGGTARSESTNTTNASG